MTSEQAEKLRVLIVDDEPVARNGLRVLLDRDPDVLIVDECENGSDAVEAIRAQRPDLVLLDVQMPGMTGLDVVRSVGVERMPPVVFTTAYDQFALDAFEINALDYLLKPFDDERFDIAIERAKAARREMKQSDLGRRLIGLLRGTDVAPINAGTVGEGEPTTTQRAEPYLTRIVVKNSGRVIFVPVGEIDWIEAADYYAKLHVGKRVHLVRESMRSLEARLDPRMFFRVHRSAIVNLNRIRELQPYFRRSFVVLLQDGTQLKLSRARREELESFLSQDI